MPEDRYAPVLGLLTAARDPVEFLTVIFKHLEHSHGRGVKSLVCKRAGFASRSYLTEVLARKKGLSRDSMLKLKSALRLSRDLGRLFELLVYKEYPAAQFPSMSSSDLLKNLAAARLQARQGLFKFGKKNVARPNVANPEVFQVYAALGPELTGATLLEIAHRSRLTERTVRQYLKILLKNGAVHQKEERFFAVTAKADDLKVEDAEAIAKMISKVSSHVGRHSSSIAEDGSSLNMYSAFSMRRERAFDFKKDLERAVMDIVDQYQDDEGDVVEQLFVNFFKNPVL